MDYATPLAQAFHQIEILKDRKRLEAPDLFIRFTPHEDRRVTVTESKPAQLRVQPSHKSCCRSASIKANIKVSGNYVFITQSFVDKIQAVFRDDRVRVQEPQHITTSDSCASVHLQSTASFRRDNFYAVGSGNFARLIIAPAVNHYQFDAHFIGARLHPASRQ